MPARAESDWGVPYDAGLAHARAALSGAAPEGAAEVAIHDCGFPGQVRRELQRELADGPYGALFRSFARRSPHAGEFESWTDLIGFLHARTAAPEVEDAILHDLLTCYQEERGPLWHTVLTLVLFPALSSIHAKTRRWTRSVDELWSDVHWAFLETAAAADLNSFDKETARKLYSNTFERLRRLYRREWRHARREKATGDSWLAMNAPGAVDPGFSAIEKREEMECVLARLRSLVDHGGLSEDELDLVLQTRVHGVDLKDAAGDRRISYEAARMRRKRAEEAIRRLIRRRRP